MVCFRQNFTSKMSLLENFTQYVIFSYTQNVLSRGSGINDNYFYSIHQYKNKTVRTNTCSKTEKKSNRNFCTLPFLHCDLIAFLSCIILVYR